MRPFIQFLTAVCLLAGILSAGGCASSAKQTVSSSSAAVKAAVSADASSSAAADASSLESAWQVSSSARSAAVSSSAVSSSKPAAPVSSSPASSAVSSAPAAQIVAVEIDGRKGKGTDVSATVTWQSGDTAYSVLQRACAQQGLKVTATQSAVGIYVKKIGTVAEVGGGTGWLYQIDGTFPGKAADAVSVSAGQRVVWVYTTDLGKSEGAPQG